MEQSQQPSVAQFGSFLRGLLRKQTFSMFVILLLIWIVLSVLSPYFFTVNNLFEITLQSAVFAIIAAGETFVIVSGGIDLSVGSVFAFSSVVGGLVFQFTGNTVLTILASILAGVFAGLVNGTCITQLKVPPFVATLGMMGIARGFALILCQGIPIYGLTKGYMWLGQGKIFGLIPVPTILVAILFLLAFFILRYTRFGRFTYAIGSNAEATRLSGININRVTLGIYMVSGMLTAIAGVIESARLGTIQPAGGAGYELLAIGAVVIGGTSLFGGEGDIIASLIGALIVTTIRNGLNILGVYAFWQYVVNGLIIIIAVSIDQMRRKG
ncbi:ribose ABC transporter permease [candidate division KSB3 bacterium]|uniref:Ribose ABC transporter permease n=1 Tax=candidate division KSB3 bacterium TaxID=2044937 RepID=A0A9D5Q4T0_9BACT|nr:ribose ABC transporter permease [candidate division KSB3 bacterium]MBD3324044.1 ribose ABC transporter permease [candidate division KSB3 bacterium]